MKKIITRFICVALIFSAGFVFAGASPFKVFVDDKEVKNNGDYIIQNNKVYVSQDALTERLGINVFYEKNENRVRILSIDTQALKGKCQNFESFSDLYDPATADIAVNQWAKGIKERNGVLQYVTLGKALKDKFKASMNENNNLSWVTGWSSPWVENYTVAKQKINDTAWKYNIVFTAKTSDPKTYYYHSDLTVQKENGKWRIVGLKSDI